MRVAVRGGEKKRGDRKGMEGRGRGKGRGEGKGEREGKEREDKNVLPHLKQAVATYVPKVRYSNHMLL